MVYVVSLHFFLIFRFGIYIESHQSATSSWCIPWPLCPLETSVSAVSFNISLLGCVKFSYMPRNHNKGSRWDREVRHSDFLYHISHSTQQLFSYHFSLDFLFSAVSSCFLSTICFPTHLNYKNTLQKHIGAFWNVKTCSYMPPLNQ